MLNLKQIKIAVNKPRRGIDSLQMTNIVLLLTVLNKRDA